MERGLVDEVNLLMAPQIVGEKAVNLFRTLNKTVRLELLKVQAVTKSHVLLKYKVKK